MTRLCIISDSHVNAMKGGWSLVEHDYPDCEVTFFAAAKDILNLLKSPRAA